MTVRGFILQPTYRIEARRPVVHLFGRLEDGATFLVRDDRETPHFFVRAMDAEQAARLGASPLTETTVTALGAGLPVRRVEVPTPPDTPALRDRLHAAGIPTYEADVRFAMRYLIQRGLRGSLEIDGPWEEDPHRRFGVHRIFHNPTLRPARWVLEPSVLSIDIETDPRARRLLSVALHGCGVSEVLLFCPQDYPCPPGAIPFAKERALLAGFCERVRQLDPDVITGWNVIDFDLKVMAEMAERFRLPFELGRGPGNVRIRPGRSAFNASQVSIPGRVVLDGPQMLRGAFIKMERYSLDHVARQVLGEGKIHSGGDRAQQILHDFKHERERFVEYNRTDARLVTDILDRLGLVALAVERSLLTGMPLDRVSASIAAFDFLYMSALMERQIASPTVGAPGHEGEPHTGGGHVLEPTPGLYEHVLVLDFQSLYPSLIRTFEIDPLGYLPGHHAFLGDPTDPESPIVAPNGAAFRRAHGILPRMLDDLVPRREAAKKAGEKVTSQAIKILMNSFYGVLGTAACRFHNGAIATAITAFGQELLLWTKERIEGYGHRVLYGDTDSLFLESGIERGGDPAAALDIGNALVERLNDDLAAHVRQRWGVESRLRLEFEKLFLRLFLPPMRHSSAGARKRYVGLVEEGGEEQVVFTGMEVVRRDWTDLARRVQRELYRRLFLDLPIEAYLKQVAREVREGQHDALLVYLKGLGKDLEEYTATAPPHVVAARKMSGKPGRLIAYTITVNGPEPAEERQSPLDLDHYVQKQLRPIAEPVLHQLGLEFDKVIGDDRQLDLF